MFWLNRWGHYRCSTLKRIKWHTNDTSIFWRELIGYILRLISAEFLPIYLLTSQIVRNHIITLSSQSSSHHLLTKQLTAKGSDSTNMSNGIGIPSLGEHRDTYYTLDLSTKFARLTHCIDYLSQYISITDIVGSSRSMGYSIFLFEFIYFLLIGSLKILVNRSTSIV